MATVNIENLHEELDKLIAEIESESPKLVKAAAIAVYSRLLARTPVDTGYARFNWRVSINEPILNPHPKVQGHRQGIKNLYPNPPTIPQVRLPKDGESIYITNNVPYIMKLNRGHSPQAPVSWGKGFIEMAIHEGLLLFSKKRK